MYIIFNRRVLLMWFLFLPSINSFSQGDILGNSKISNFGIKEYKGSRQNWSITFSKKDNLIYIANSKGLLEYDGVNWQLYKFPKIIRSVFIDSNDRIFTGALGEFGIWSRNAKGKLTYESLTKKINLDGIDQESIWNIEEIDNGIFFQSFAYAFILLKNGNIQQITLPSNVQFLCKVNNDFLIPGIGTGIYKMRTDKTFEILDGSEQFFKNRSVSNILWVDNKIYVFTTNGIFVKNGKTYLPLKASLNEFFKKAQINKAVLLRNGLIAVGTILEGIVIIDKEGFIIEHITKDRGLVDNTVLSLFVDKEDNLWIGTDNGVSRINTSDKIRYIEDNSGQLGTVYDVAKYRGKLMVASNHGVFNIVNRGNGYEYQLINGTQGQVWSLDNIDGNLIVGHNDGTFLVNNNDVKKISVLTGGWKVILPKKDSSLLLQSTYNKLVIYRKGKYNKLDFSHAINGITGKQFFEDTNGKIWIKTSANTVSQISLDSSYKKVITRKNYNFTADEDAYLQLFAKYDTVWVQNGGHLYFWSENLKAFVKERNSKAIKHFVFADDITISLGKENRVQFSQKGKSIEIPLFGNNSFVEEYEQVKLIDGILYFCFNDGLALIKLTDIYSFKDFKNQKPTLRYLKSDDFPEFNQDFAGKKTKTVQIPYKANSFEMVFSPGSFSNNVLYQYQLMGYSNGWSEFQQVNTKSFHNLPSGNYIMRLRSNLSKDEDIIFLKILPPWYWSLWAKVSYILLIAFFIYLGKTFYNRNLAKHKRKLFEKHQKELEKQQQEIIKLNNEQLEAALIRKSEELANSTMAVIKKNDLLKVIKEKALSEIPSGKQSSIARLIDRNISTEQDWKVFETNFNQVHETFLKKFSQKYPNLSHGDLKLAAYLRMNLSTKEIANLINITVRGVELKRYRLRKKLKLDNNTDLNEFMMKQ